MYKALFMTNDGNKLSGFQLLFPTDVFKGLSIIINRFIAFFFSSKWWITDKQFVANMSKIFRLVTGYGLRRFHTKFFVTLGSYNFLPGGGGVCLWSWVANQPHRPKSRTEWNCGQERRFSEYSIINHLNPLSALLTYTHMSLSCHPLECCVDIYVYVVVLPVGKLKKEKKTPKVQHSGLVLWSECQQ